MGMTNPEELLKIEQDLFAHYEGKLLLDAGALEALARLPNYLIKKPQVLLTPHHGEFARLVGVSYHEIDANPLKYAIPYAKTHHVVLLLKGHETFITDGETVYRNTFGNAGQAKAGSGDLLSGILCGIMAQNLPHSLLEEATFGAYLFGKSAMLLAQEQNEYSFLAEDILRMLPKAMDPCVAKE
jgi:NAD(P)H-hydrate epimerase